MIRTITRARQLILPFAEPEVFAHEDFIEAGSNAMARAALANPESWVNGRLVLWGGEGSGKSHLAAVWAATRGARLLSATTLRAPIDPPACDIVIEDIDAAIDPLALLASLNLAQALGRVTLLTCRTPPARLDIGPPDLASRLHASLTIGIGLPEDALLDALFQRLAAARQITFSDGLRRYLLARLPRRPGVLREAIARLDRTTMAHAARPTRRLAEAALGDLFELGNAPGCDQPGERSASDAQLPL